MTQIEERRKLLADEYGIHSYEELIRARRETAGYVKFFISVFGGSSTHEQENGGDTAQIKQ